jgi:uncharacterized alkaline shock family protein YloU
VSDHLSIPSELGAVTISTDAVAQIVEHTAAECYGVVGLEAPNLAGKLLRKDGIEIAARGGTLRIALHVAIEHGLNLAEVASTVRSRVAYEVERMTGLGVDAVEVHIQKVRRSA